MYDWRHMSPEDRKKLLTQRKAERRPWHKPPHWDLGEGAYHLTAACYEHAHIIGTTPQRLADFEEQLLSVAALGRRPKDVSAGVQANTESAAVGSETQNTLHAWSVLPNHYHLLVETPDIEALLSAIGELHGRTSHTWNGEENARGRKVWFDRVERAIRSDRHFWVTMNYVHHNPVRHGHVTKWQDWPFSSARGFLEKVGREEAARIWREYPLLDYGKGWDEPDL